MSKFFSAAFFLTSVFFASVTLAQPPVPRPGPDHKHLEQYVGTWDCQVKMGEEMSKGSSVYKMDLGGLWLTSHFEGEIAGTKFQGHGYDTYDVAKKKYIGVWMDSMTTQPMHMEGSLDKDGKTLTMIGDAPGMDGKPMKVTNVTKFTDPNSFVFTMTGPGESGKESVILTITYKRRK